MSPRTYITLGTDYWKFTSDFIFTSNTEATKTTVFDLTNHGFYDDFTLLINRLGWSGLHFTIHVLSQRLFVIGADRARAWPLLDWQQRLLSGHASRPWYTRLPFLDSLITTKVCPLGKIKILSASWYSKSALINFLSEASNGILWDFSPLSRWRCIPLHKTDVIFRIFKVRGKSRIAVDGTIEQTS